MTMRWLWIRIFPKMGLKSTENNNLLRMIRDLWTCSNFLSVLWTCSKSESNENDAKRIEHTNGVKNTTFRTNRIEIELEKINYRTKTNTNPMVRLHSTNDYLEPVWRHIEAVNKLNDLKITSHWRDLKWHLIHQW